MFRSDGTELRHHDEMRGGFEGGGADQVNGIRVTISGSSDPIVEQPSMIMMAWLGVTKATDLSTLAPV